MRKDVRKAVSWIEDFMGRAAKEIERINSVRADVNDEISKFLYFFNFPLFPVFMKIWEVIFSFIFPIPLFFYLF